ncbi:FkbM family methyltransferase [Rhodocytophaga rosea]|uniref:FkbM family methyltransferase n=1 Tax=Rhodocytophaga rosea TaxID=2704465 RepID=A0A6C0GNI1_9BACT|nr:FkbM family methyltransferase [Rhodocytophaga rosea]QHT69589.1 FkbM family methyltransferase [Rhodocytophaga rosea]
MIKRRVNKILKQFGLQISRIPQKQVNSHANPIDSMYAGMTRGKQTSIQPATIIDVGAASGDWTKKALTLWPEAEYVLFEPLLEREQVLAAFAAVNRNIHIVKAAAGDKPGEIPFSVTDDLDGSGIADPATQKNYRSIPVTTIDGEIERLKLKGPYLLKLDTHGYEVPILIGADNTLKQAQLVIIECYGFQIASGSLLFWEMCRLMQEKGFRLYDIVDIMRRKKDQAFWQCDAFFIPSTSTIFDSNTYR